MAMESEDVIAKNRLMDVYLRFSDEELNRMAYDQLDESYDLVSVGTDGSDHRRVADCRSEGRGFYSGFATTCFVGGFFHPDVGISAAHRNSVPLTLVRENYTKVRTDSPTDDHPHIPLADLIRGIVHRGYQLETLFLTIDQAQREFAHMSGSFPPGTKLILGGGFYLYNNDIVALNDAARELAQYLSGNIHVVSNLGNSTGFLYVPEEHRLLPPGLGYWDLQRFDAIQ